MTLDQAVELVKGWPKDRTVPRKLAEGIVKASNKDAMFMGQLVEALTVAAVSEEDYKLISKYF